MTLAAVALILLAVAVVAAAADAHPVPSLCAGGVLAIAIAILLGVR